MAIGDTYVSLTELKDYLKIPAAKQSLDDALRSALESSTAEIERHCNRQFNKATSATPRLYEPDGCDWSYVDDFHTSSDLLVEVDTGGNGSFSTVDASAYEVYPYNGIVDGQPGWPFYRIDLATGVFPGRTRRRAVLRVTAQWGWSEIPAPVRQACLIMAAETFQLKDAPFGVAGADQFGTLLRVRDNKMAAAKLARYCKSRLMVG